MQLIAIIANFRLQDILDIFFLTVVVYHLYLWFQGTKAFKAFVGLLVLGIIYTTARAWGLFLTTWVFQIFWQVLVILLIILFQSEIRQVLERVNPLKVLGLRKHSKPEEWIPGFAGAVFRMAKEKMGALFIIEREDRVAEFVTEGHELEADTTPELLTGVFQKASPLHDGAVIIRGGRLTQVACYLPLSSRQGLPKDWGTRHRAALGLSERCDAWVVVVSEERGQVGVAREGRMDTVDTPEVLSRLLLESIQPHTASKKTPGERIRLFMTNRWQTKLGALALVSILWLLLAGQQNFEVVLRVPLETKNIPTHLRVLRPENPLVKITVRGLRKDASTLTSDNVSAVIDLGRAAVGKNTVHLTPSQVMLPNDRVQVVKIEPPKLEFSFEKRH